MANLTEASSWDNVYEFTTTDPIQGGPGGIDNQPHQSLLNRTKWLRDNLVNKIGDAMTGLLSITLASAVAFRIRSGATGSFASMVMGRAADEFEVGIAATANAFITGSVAGDVSIRSISGKVLIGSGSAPGLVVDASGNVGVKGVPAAGAGFDVFGAVRVNSQDFINLNGAKEGRFGWQAYTANGAWNLGTNGDPIAFLVGTEAMRVNASRRVLIGKTTDDGSLLQVNGSMSLAGSLSAAAYNASFATYLSFSGEGYRGVYDSSYLSFWNTANTTRTGYIQYIAGGAVIIGLENALNFQLIAPNTVDKCIMSTDGTWYPGRNNVSDLGATASRWRILWAGGADFSTNITANGAHVTTLNDFSASFSAVGYQRLPGGLILQWGSVALGDLPLGSWSTLNITFPLAFPNACLAAIPEMYDANATTAGGRDNKLAWASQSKSTTGFTLLYADATSSSVQNATLYWYAIGY